MARSKSLAPPPPPAVSISVPLGMNATENDNYFDSEIWNESCIWVGKDISMIGGVHFEFDAEDPSKPWHISESNGRAEIDFYPDARKQEQHNLMIAKINYYQQCGRFRGWLVDDSGTKHEVNDIYGVAEEFTVSQ